MKRAAVNRLSFLLTASAAMGSLVLLSAGCAKEETPAPSTPGYYAGALRTAPVGTKISRKVPGGTGSQL